MFNLNPDDYPHIKELINLFINWDRKADVNNKAAAHWYVYFKHLRKSVKKLKLDVQLPVEDSILVKSLEYTQDFFMHNFGTLDVLHGEFQKHIRANVQLPVPGLMDMIAATSSNKYDSTKIKAVSGDSYIMLIRYSEDKVEIETVLPYGISNHEDSPHHTDQMHMYVNHQRKRMTLDKDEIYKTAKSIYHPK